MSAANTFPFRRLTDPLILPVNTTATKFDVPSDFFGSDPDKQRFTSFWVVNPNLFWVRLRGSSDSTHVPVTATTGWLFPPGFCGVFSTQYPVSMSTMAVTFQGLPAGTGTLEVSYGAGA